MRLLENQNPTFSGTLSEYLFLHFSREKTIGVESPEKPLMQRKTVETYPPFFPGAFPVWQ